MSEKINFLNIEMNNLSQIDLLEKMKKGVLITPNVDHIITLQKDFLFYKIYKNADWIICDSKILGLGFKFLGKNLKEVIPGSSFFTNFCNYHKDNENVKIFLLGSKPGVALEAKLKINNRIGREIIVGAHSPSFGFEKNLIECEQILKLIKKTEANVLLVGVGAPKQEKWIFEYKENLPQIDIFMALGATIDFEAGILERAPKWMQKISLEWLFRLLKEPKRLWKRYLIDDPKIIVLILKEKFGRYTNPFKNFVKND